MSAPHLNRKLVLEAPIRVADRAGGFAETWEDAGHSMGRSNSAQRVPSGPSPGFQCRALAIALSCAARPRGPRYDLRRISVSWKARAAL